MEPFFLLFLLHSSVFFVSSDSAAFLSSKFPSGRGCAEKISFPVLSKHSDPADICTAERESIPAKRTSQSRGRTVMDSENHEAMIINDTDNGSEQSAAISREQETGGRFMADLCTQVSHQPFVFVKSQYLIRSSARKG